jgi:hypothetical protein
VNDFALILHIMRRNFFFIKVLMRENVMDNEMKRELVKTEKETVLFRVLQLTGELWFAVYLIGVLHRVTVDDSFLVYSAM